MPRRGPPSHFHHRHLRCGAGTLACAPPKAGCRIAECGIRNAERRATHSEQREPAQLRRPAPRADRSVCATKATTISKFSILNFQFGLALILAFALLAPAAAAAPHRIVTLVPSAAEILDGLGIADRIVGVTDYTDFPPSMIELPHVGAFNNLNTEAIVALRPDLLVATTDGNSPATLDRLRRLGFDVLVLDLRYWNTTRTGIIALGAKTGRDAEGRALVAEMDRVASCIAGATKGAERPRVLYAFDMDPVIAPGQESFTNEMIEMAGGASVTKGNPQPYPRISAEGLIALAPEVIVVTTMNPSRDLDAWKQWLGRWPTIPAVKAGAIRGIDSRTIDRPSQRLVFGLRDLAASLHPELFPAGVCEPKWKRVSE